MERGSADFSGSTLRARVIKLYLVEKKIARIRKRIEGVPGLSEDEKHLFARSLAASPDERWRLHENYLRSHNLFTRSARKKFDFK